MQIIRRQRETAGHAVGLAIVVAVALTPACSTHSPLPAGTSVDLAQAVPEAALNRDVREDTIDQTICVPGYAASVRPSSGYTNGVKAKLLRERGLTADAMPAFELDHRVPLVLGGHPRDLSNLTLQPWEGDSGAKAKDRRERQLQALVCSHQMPLEVARREMYFGWSR